VFFFFFFQAIEFFLVSIYLKIWKAYDE